MSTLEEILGICQWSRYDPNTTTAFTTHLVKMKHNSHLLIPLLSSIAITGCASKAISPEAANVQVHRQVSALLSDCRKLGPVKGTGSKPFGNALPSNGAFNDALAELKEATANVRGDSVAVLSSNEALTQVTLQGVAYKCY